MRLFFLLLTVAALSVAQEVPAPQLATPLTADQKLQAAESFILLQGAQQVLMRSAQWQVFQERDQKHKELMAGLRQATGALGTCNLTAKQEWVTQTGTPCVIAAQPAIIQSTGPNSPNIIGNKGDVKIEIGDEKKESDDPAPAPK